MDIRVEIKGLRELQAKFNALSGEMQTEVRAIIEAGAKDWVRGAKRAAAVDNGFLKNGITYGQGIADKTHCTFFVFSNAKYSPYIEWGTITKVSVPEELSNYAIQFKGKGLLKTGGITPSPFFFPQQLPVKKATELRIKALVETVKV